MISFRKRMKMVKNRESFMNYYRGLGYDAEKIWNKLHNKDARL